MALFPGKVGDWLECLRFSPRVLSPSTILAQAPSLAVALGSGSERLQGSELALRYFQSILLAQVNLKSSPDSREEETESTS